MFTIFALVRKILPSTQNEFLECIRCTRTCSCQCDAKRELGEYSNEIFSKGSYENILRHNAQETFFSETMQINRAALSILLTWTSADTNGAIFSRNISYLPNESVGFLCLLEKPFCQKRSVGEIGPLKYSVRKLLDVSGTVESLY